MSRRLLALSVLALLCWPMPVAAQTQATPPPSPLTAGQALANAAALTRRRTAADCRQEAAAAIARGEQDIIVCAVEQDQALPVPEVYGPVHGSTDGRAVEIHSCGLGLQNPCFEGVDVFRVAGFLGDKLPDIINPDRDLGPGTPIPQRYRGANR